MSRIEWHPAARADLFDLYDWVAEQADPDTAFAYTAAIEAHCTKLVYGDSLFTVTVYLCLR